MSMLPCHDGAGRSKPLVGTMNTSSTRFDEANDLTVRSSFPSSAPNLFRHRYFTAYVLLNTRLAVRLSRLSSEGNLGCRLILTVPRPDTSERSSLFVRVAIRPDVTTMSERKLSLFRLVRGLN